MGNQMQGDGQVTELPQVCQTYSWSHAGGMWASQISKVSGVYVPFQVIPAIYWMYSREKLSVVMYMRKSEGKSDITSPVMGLATCRFFIHTTNSGIPVEWLQPNLHQMVAPNFCLLLPLFTHKLKINFQVIGHHYYCYSDYIGREAFVQIWVKWRKRQARDRMIECFTYTSQTV